MPNLAILADSKTQNVSLFHAMFRHDCPLTVKMASTQWKERKERKKKKKKKEKRKKKTWRDSAPIDMFLSAVSVLVVVQLSSEVLVGLMNNPVFSSFQNETSNLPINLQR
jgi:hypothetical protein